MGEAGIFAENARVELINGEIIDMAAIDNRHMSKMDRLTRSMVMAVGERAIVRVQGSARINDFSEPEPDLLLLRPRQDFYDDTWARPTDILILIEVTSSSLRYDTEVKLPLYANEDVPEVWIVDIVNSQLNRYANPVSGRWTFEDSPANLSSLTPRQLDDMTLDLSGLFNQGS